MDAVMIRRRLKLLGITSFISIALIVLWLAFAPGRQHYLAALPIFKTPRPSVTLRQGTYIGVVYKRGYPQYVEEFRGVPFGQSTAGEGRFSPPVPIDASNETFDASAHGYRCPSGERDGDGVHDQDEDCLNANIMRPQERPNKKLPVVINFYGGSFNFGSGPSRQLPNLVAWSSEPLIGVTFNYRVGALGFLPSKLTEKEGLLNVGLKDQRLLLEWVRDNIEDFGGDKDDVTLMGVSAGAHGIGHHMMQNTDQSTLFHKAIIESGGTTARACYTPGNPIHKQQFQEFITLLGCEDVPEPQLINSLRGLPVNSIVQASQTIFRKYHPSVRWPFQPAIDGEGGMIPIRPIDTLRSGPWKKIPILTGFNTNEGSMFVPRQLNTNEQFMEFFQTLLPGLSEHDLSVLQEVYPNPVADPTSKFVETRQGVGLGPQFKRTEQAYGQFAYIAPVKQTLRAAVEGGATAYLYHFAVNSSIKGGADHGSNTGYPTFNHDVRDASPTLEKVAGSMHAYWTSFITTGDPNKVQERFLNRPFWPLYVKGKGQLMVFGEGNDERAGGGHSGEVATVEDDTWMEKECEFWWERTEKFEL